MAMVAKARCRWSNNEPHERYNNTARPHVRHRHGGPTGFDLLRALGEDKPHMIFTTAHDSYAVKAIRPTHDKRLRRASARKP